jgi:hypothetical protein
MLNTQKQRISANIFQRRAKPVEKAKDDAGVGQDKIALTRDRTPSRQPALYKKLSRSQTTGKKTQRTQMQNGVKKRTVELSLWVNPVVKAELARLAERNGLSLSATGGALLERALQENIDMEYGANRAAACPGVVLLRADPEYAN